MTVLRVFDQHKTVEAAEQEYELAKEHHAEVMKNMRPGNEAHRQRFEDAMERLESARAAFLRAMEC